MTITPTVLPYPKKDEKNNETIKKMKKLNFMKSIIGSLRRFYSSVLFFSSVWEVLLKGDTGVQRF